MKAEILHAKGLLVPRIRIVAEDDLEKVVLHHMFQAPEHAKFRWAIQANLHTTPPQTGGEIPDTSEVVALELYWHQTSEKMP